MSERSSRHATSNRNRASIDKFKKLLENNDDGFDEDSESSGYSDYGYSESGDAGMEDFVVGERYQDDFEEPTKASNKKKPDVKPKETIVALLQKQAPKKDTKKAIPKAAPAKNDHDLDAMLSMLDDDNDRKDSRKEKRMRKQTKQVKAPYVPKAYVKQPEVTMDDDDDDFAPPPPEPEPQPVQVQPVPQPKPVVEMKPKPAPVKPEVMPMNFEIEDVTGEGLDLSADATAERISTLDVEVGGELDMYLFHVHEEEGLLFLFGKYERNHKFYTICVKVANVYYNLQFLPIDGRTDQLIEEVKSVARKCKGGCTEAVVERRKYCFEDPMIEDQTDWVVAKFIAKTKLADIPPQGNHYSNVFGVTASLTERFFVDTRIMGPTWVRIKNIKGISQIASVPMVTVKLSDDIEIIEAEKSTIPSFNVCTMAIRTAFNQKKKKNEIFMISMMFKQSWDIENFKENVKNSESMITFVCSLSNTNLSTEYCNAMRNSKNVRICSNEKELLVNFVKQLEKMDVDILASYGLTSFDIPLICERLYDHNVQDYWMLGRLQRKLVKGAKPKWTVVMGGRLPVDVRVSCGEFWKSKANDFSSIVKEMKLLGDKDRQQIDHFDLSQKVSDRRELQSLVGYNMRDSRLIGEIMKKIQILPLTLQISKLSGCPWIRVVMGQASHRCETLLLHRFSELKYIIPEKQKSAGPMKREAKYKGGMVLTPKRGFYETCICVLDFNSLYPSIIREFNICFTTVDKSKADHEGAEYESKKKRDVHNQEGILPMIMKMLLEARTKVKDAIKKNNEDKKNARNERQLAAIETEIVRLTIKEKAIKVLANSMYGYLGFKSSRFQANHLAALITKCGRNILEDTVKHMENQQFDVVYGDTDSVMVNTNTKDPEDAKRIAGELSKAISGKYRFLRLGIDYVFQKMLLVQKKKYAAMVYLGKDEPPRIDKKGLDMVRRDWSVITVKLSEFIIEQFMSDDDRDSSINAIITELETIASIMNNGGIVDPSRPSHISAFANGIGVEHLVITKALKKQLSDYPDNDISPHVAVARRMQSRGEVVPQNATIEYVICQNDGEKALGKKAFLPQEVTDFGSADINWYLVNQLLHPLWRLCEPFGGMDMSMVGRALGLNTVVRTVERYETDTSRASLIPHVCNLSYECCGCHKHIQMTTNIDECFACPECKFEHKWKYVANQLIRCARNFLSNSNKTDYDRSCHVFKCNGVLCNYRTIQLPVRLSSPRHYNIYKEHETVCTGALAPVTSTVEIYNTLRYFTALFDPHKTPTKNEEFREYMKSYMDTLIKSHSFSCLSFKSLFGKQEIVQIEEEDALDEE